jgi:hypothetical protein
VDARRRHDVGVVLLRPRAEPDVLQHGQPRLVEPRPAPRRRRTTSGTTTASTRTSSPTSRSAAGR